MDQNQQYTPFNSDIPQQPVSLEKPLTPPQQIDPTMQGMPDVGMMPPPQMNQQPFQTPAYNPYPPQPPVLQETLAEESTSGTKLVYICAIALAVILIFFGIFCIIRDIQRGTSSGGYVAGDIVEVHIGTQNKPDVDPVYVDENGRYTTEGIAQLVRPSIVEVYTYEDEQTASTIGLGSGIIISGDGYIVTNTHVLEGGTYYQVKLSDESVHTAALVGRDAKTDIAVLKIAETGLTAAALGNSDEVVLGEEVVAIGNPAGLSGTISNGIVSGLNRPIRTDTTSYEMNCIQTNAAISSGNSGGALVNMYGQVIGITSSKYVSTTYEGLGFAITINEALPIIEELISKGYVGGRVRIGISFYSTLDNYSIYMFEQSMGYALPENLEALWIDEVAEDCDVSNTDLRPGDFIYEVNGMEVSDYDTLCAAIDGQEAGDTVVAKCLRLDEKGKEHRFTISFKLMEDTSGDY